MKTTAICQSCSRPFQVDASRAAHGRGKSCSRACQYVAVSKALGKKVQLTCIGCGNRFTRPLHYVGPGGKGKFCSRPCRDANRVGILHPQYLHGKASEDRGPNWQAQKRKARKRDQRTCQHCGRPGKDVHHIKPYRLFGGDFLRANNLVNLITLCASCHRTAEAKVQASERQHS